MLEEPHTNSSSSTDTLIGLDHWNARQAWQIGFCAGGPGPSNRKLYCLLIQSYRLPNSLLMCGGRPHLFPATNLPRLTD